MITSGSSPLARGLPSSLRSEEGGTGIIPARAGFTSSPQCRPSPAGDHPRSRGVYSDRHPRLRGVEGSSPLARGLPPQAAGAGGGGGIIPARAGFTDLLRARAARTQDHPRSRGVYAGIFLAPSPRVGSSPLARGLPQEIDGEAGENRIIPARAGFTVWQWH